MLLTEADFDEKSVAYFTDLLKANVVNHSLDQVTHSKTLEILMELWSYTGGQMYPFVTIAKYACESHADDCLNGCIQSLICNQEFYNSNTYKTIVSRSLAVSLKAKNAAKDIYVHGAVSFSAANAISREGYWDSTRQWFISNLFMSYLFQSTENKLIIPQSCTNVEHLLTLALQNFTEAHFHQSDNSIERYENALGYYFGASLSSYQLYVSPQHIIPKAIKTSGPEPCVDYFINGNFNIFIELIKDGTTATIAEHLQRFTASNGKYSAIKGNFVLLDFQITAKKVELTNNDKIFTFVKKTNTLYRGRKIIKKDVSPFLQSSFKPKVCAGSILDHSF
jgi:hypothetical protein